jgi:hypothetical protein
MHMFRGYFIAFIMDICASAVQRTHAYVINQEKTTACLFCWAQQSHILYMSSIMRRRSSVFVLLGKTIRRPPALDACQINPHIFQ